MEHEQLISETLYEEMVAAMETGNYSEVGKIAQRESDNDTDDAAAAIIISEMIQFIASETK